MLELLLLIPMVTVALAVVCLFVVIVYAATIVVVRGRRGRAHCACGRCVKLARQGRTATRCH